MTRQRIDSHSTEFGLWLREQKDIDSRLGFVATNIDYMWRNYKTGIWILIEEKRHGSQLQFPQSAMLDIVTRACQNDKNYKGLHILVFQNTSPDDGLMWLDKKQITKDELIKFLRFEL